MAEVTQKQIADYVASANEAIEASEKLAAEINATNEKVASYAPDLVKSLVGAGLIADTDAAAASEKIASHSGAVEMLHNFVGIFQADRNKQASDADINGSGTAAPTPSPATKSDSGSVVMCGEKVSRRKLGDDEFALAESLGIF